MVFSFLLLLALFMPTVVAFAAPGDRDGSASRFGSVNGNTGGVQGNNGFTNNNGASGSDCKDQDGNPSLCNPLENKTIIDLFNDLVDIVLVFATPIIVFFIIYAGFLYVTARGNTEQITNASRALTYAIIGGLLILGAKVLLVVIQGTVAAIGA